MQKNIQFTLNGRPVTAQVGKYYNLPGALEPETYALLTRIKDLLDPDRRLNPGNLGWQ